MRLDKLLSHMGFGTRKEVKTLLKNGHVYVNGVVAKKANEQVDPDQDIINVDGEDIIYEEFVYYMLNKPQGYVSATTDHLYPTVVELIDDFRQLFPVGRLDVDTEGLILLTNDGQFAHHITSPRSHVDKLYYAELDSPITQEDITIFKDGIVLDGDRCLSAQLVEADDDLSHVYVTIQEGKYHQVKRMFEACHHKVLYLKRIKIGSLVLDETLEPGEYRPLTRDEINGLSR